MEQKTKKLLDKIFLSSIKSSVGVNALRFRAENYELINEIENMEHKGFLEKIDGNYYVKIITLPELSKTLHQAKHLIFFVRIIIYNIAAVVLGATRSQHFIERIS